MAKKKSFWQKISDAASNTIDGAVRAIPGVDAADSISRGRPGFTAPSVGGALGASVPSAPTPQTPVIVPGVPAVSTQSARANDYYGTGPISQGLNANGAPVPGAPPADPNADLLAAALAALGGAPDVGSYTAPYDAAMKTAHGAYDAAVPVIRSTYDDLVRQLAAARTAQQGQSATEATTNKSQMDQLIAQLSGMNAGVLKDIATQGGAIQQGAPTAAAQAYAQAQQSGLQQQAGQQQQYLGNVAAARDASMADRISGASGSKAAALASAANNLDAVLNQLGIQKAGAQRQGAADAANYAQRVANVHLQYLQQRQHQNDQATKSLQDVLKQSQETSGDQWQRTELPGIIGKFPKASQAFLEIVSATKGKGAQGMAQALNILQQAAPALSTGAYKDASGNTISNRIDPNVLADWIRNYYSDTPSINPDKFSQLTGILNLAG